MLGLGLLVLEASNSVLGVGCLGFLALYAASSGVTNTALAPREKRSFGLLLMHFAPGFVALVVLGGLYYASGTYAEKTKAIAEAIQADCVEHGRCPQLPKGWESDRAKVGPLLAPSLKLEYTITSDRTRFQVAANLPFELSKGTAYHGGVTQALEPGRMPLDVR